MTACRHGTPAGGREGREDSSRERGVTATMSTIGTVTRGTTGESNSIARLPLRTPASRPSWRVGCSYAGSCRGTCGCRPWATATVAVAVVREHRGAGAERQREPQAGGAPRTPAGRSRAAARRAVSRPPRARIRRAHDEFVARVSDTDVVRHGSPARRTLATSRSACRRWMAVVVVDLLER